MFLQSVSKRIAMRAWPETAFSGTQMNRSIYAAVHMTTMKQKPNLWAEVRLSPGKEVAEQVGGGNSHRTAFEQENISIAWRHTDAPARK